MAGAWQEDRRCASRGGKHLTLVCEFFGLGAITLSESVLAATRRHGLRSACKEEEALAEPIDDNVTEVVPSDITTVGVGRGVDLNRSRPKRKPLFGLSLVLAKA